MSKIYTKTGDGGTTGTFYGRMAKSDQLAQALGVVDELNSWVGLCRSRYPIFSVQYSVMDNELKEVQSNLLTIGSQLAGSGEKLGNEETKRLERLIDRLTKELPKLTSFIYPVGYLQVVRSVCRRAEREVVAAGIKEKNILKYLNRLSDALFVVGRWVNLKAGIEEEVWKG